MKLRHLILSASAAILAACSTTTPYQEASKPGGFDGFSQTLIENDRARVTFGGNSVTERETVENYLLYRAAELTVERGYEYFTLTERDIEADTRLQSTGSSFNDPYFGYSFYNPRFGWSRNFAFSSFGGFAGSRGFGTSGFNSFDRFGRSGFNSFGGSSFGFGGPSSVREITKYKASAEVKFGRGTKPIGADNSFNAKEVIQNIGPSIIYPEEKS